MRWVLDVVPGICTDDQFLFGGCGLGAAIEALERTTGRPAVWAVAQYLSFAHPPEIVDIDVTIASAGHQTTQARAVAHVGDREILTVNAALGERDGERVRCDEDASADEFGVDRDRRVAHHRHDCHASRLDLGP